MDALVRNKLVALDDVPTWPVFAQMNHIGPNSTATATYQTRCHYRTLLLFCFLSDQPEFECSPELNEKIGILSNTNITHLKIGAIVNAANSELEAGGGGQYPALVPLFDCLFELSSLWSNSRGCWRSFTARMQSITPY